MIMPHSVSELTEVLSLADHTMGRIGKEIDPFLDVWTSEFYQGTPSAMGESMRAKGMPQDEVDVFVEELAAQFRRMSTSIQALNSYCAAVREYALIALDIVQDGATRARRAQPPEARFQI
jgi:hypothetical protein